MASSISNSKGPKAPWRESTIVRKQYNTFDTKSIGDVCPPDFDSTDSPKVK
jgi:hypothetical protein